jgi:hypothetical protein
MHSILISGATSSLVNSLPIIGVRQSSIMGFMNNEPETDATELIAAKISIPKNKPLCFKIYPKSLLIVPFVFLGFLTGP